MIKTCDNCAYARGTLQDGGRCMRTGDYQSIQRMWPNKRCDDDFSGWVEAPKVIAKPKWLMRILGVK